MPDQVTHRVRCPACAEWAQLRIAEPFEGPQSDPVIVMFSCPNQTDEGHVIPGDEALAELIPADAGLED